MTSVAEYFFRHEYGKLVSTLCRRMGLEHLVAAEGVVGGVGRLAWSVWQRRLGGPVPAAIRDALSRRLDTAGPKG